MPTDTLYSSLPLNPYARTPGIHTAEQVAAWRAVTDAVHQGGGHIFVQLMHAGRIAHPLNRQTDEPPVAPSAIAPATAQLRSSEDGQRLLDAGQADATVYGQLYLANPDLVERFRRGAALNDADPDSFYTPGPQGYIDYPSLAAGSA